MARHHMTAEGPVPFTHEEEAEWDAREAEWEAGANDRKAAEVRSERDQLLRDTVDTINPMRWESMTIEQQDALRAYRQALLDVPQQLGFPFDVKWPQTPG